MEFNTAFGVHTHQLQPLDYVRGFSHMHTSGTIASEVTDKQYIIKCKLAGAEILSIKYQFGQLEVEYQVPNGKEKVNSQTIRHSVPDYCRIDTLQATFEKNELVIIIDLQEDKKAIYFKL